MKKTVILGATPNTSRFAYLAASRLDMYGFDFVPVGIKKGEVLGKQILNAKSVFLPRGQLRHQLRQIRR